MQCCGEYCAVGGFGETEGIVCAQVAEKPTQVRVNTLLTPRHITQRSKVRMHARRYHPKKDSPKVRRCGVDYHERGACVGIERFVMDVGCKCGVMRQSA